MKVKVCGMREPDNIREVGQLPIDWMGFIFYAPSPRYAGSLSPEEIDRQLPRRIKRVGVFVNEEAATVQAVAARYRLAAVQLHGAETPETCAALRATGLEVIKAFSLSAASDLEACLPYEGSCDYFLFDTRTPLYGGSGRQYDWNLLAAYRGRTPFLLSGGIGEDDALRLQAFSHPLCAGIDLNSRFEQQPGRKDAGRLQRFLSILKLNKQRNNMETNRINHLLQDGRINILSVYFTAGYPRLSDTLPTLRELQRQGVDMVEIGIPFSDPMADGPVIQQSSTVALRNGMSLRVLFDQLRDVRREITIPLILMGYLNPIMQYGFENFCRTCAETGIDGMIIPDLPFNDYLRYYKPIADRYHLRIIMLITPETTPERIRLIDAHTDGFIYMVSSASTTGAQQSFNESKQEYFRRINGMNLRNPRLIGFGISNKATLEAAQANASGAIIGSKFVSLLGTAPSVSEAVTQLLDDLKH